MPLRITLLLSLLLSSALAAQTSRPGQDVPGGAAGVGLGYALAMDAERLVVGRPAIAIGFPVPPSDPGAVLVYGRSDAGWGKPVTLHPRASEVGDYFGAAVALDAARLAVGGPGHGDGDAGAVWVFVGGAEWTETGMLRREGGAAGDRFGASVALRGDWLIAGAPGAADGRGAAVLYRRRGTEWRPVATLSPAGADSGAAFGHAVALDGEHAYVGAPGPNPMAGLGAVNQAARPGAVFVYRLRDNPGNPVATLTPSDTAARSFGAALLADGAALWVGAPASGTGRGAVVRLDRRGNRWSESATLIAAPSTTTPPGPPARLVGFSLARSGADLLVGAPFARGAGGAVLVFRAGADGAWAQAARLEPAVAGIAGLAGFAVAAHGDAMVTGMPMSEFFAGVGHAYRRTGTEWAAAGTVVDEDAGLRAVSGEEQRCAEGTAGGFRCDNVDLLAFIPTEALGAPRGIMMNDIWGWTDPETSREIAIVGRMDATVFVDVTDPVSPVILGTLPLTEGARPNLWRDMKVYKDHAFIVSDGAGPHGMQVFDLTRLRTATPGQTFQPDTVYRNIHSSHNIAINEASGFAYMVGNSMGGETCGGALHMVDIRDPKRPTFAGCYADASTGNNRQGSTHDTQCVMYEGPDERYRGHEICFNSSETALGIADVSDKAAPKAIGKASHPNTAYTHQGWLSEDQRHFFVNDEGDEVGGLVPRTRTIVYDVSDLEDPVVLTEFLGTTAASDHNLYVRGRYMFQSNYVSGLRVIDIADPAHPVEVGYFDTVPGGENAPGFAGSWSNYPYFPSGTIVVTSMREGLFVLRHRPDAPVP